MGLVYGDFELILVSCKVLKMEYCQPKRPENYTSGIQFDDDCRS